MIQNLKETKSKTYLLRYNKYPGKPTPKDGAWLVRENGTDREYQVASITCLGVNIQTFCDEGTSLYYVKVRGTLEINHGNAIIKGAL